MDWREWALNYKDENDITFAELTKLVNIKFDMDMTYDAVRKAIYRFKTTLNDEMNIYPNNEEKRLENDVRASQGHCESERSTENVLDELGYDKNEWMVKRSSTSIRNNGSKEVKYTRVDVVPKSEEEQVTLEKLNELLDKSLGYKPKSIEEIKVNEGLTKLITVSDLHLNLLADEQTTGNEYNIEIAVDRFEKTIADNIRQMNNVNIENIILLIGNDFINADNINGNTTKGTPQDNETNWFEASDIATNLIIDAVNSLKLAKPNANIIVLNVPSNHDLHTMYSITRSIEIYYKDDLKVSVVNNPRDRNYLVVGKVGILFAHDIKKVDKNILTILTNEFKYALSNINHCYVMLGHLHNEMKYQKIGIAEIYRLPTCSGWSRWSNTMGYSNNYLNQSFLIDDEEGIIQENYTKFY